MRNTQYIIIIIRFPCDKFLHDREKNVLHPRISVLTSDIFMCIVNNVNMPYMFHRKWISCHENVSFNHFNQNFHVYFYVFFDAIMTLAEYISIRHTRFN